MVVCSLARALGLAVVAIIYAGCVTDVTVSKSLNDEGKALKLQAKDARCGAPLLDDGDNVATHRVIGEIVLEDPVGYVAGDRDALKARLVGAACELGADAVIIRRRVKVNPTGGWTKVHADAIRYTGGAAEAGGKPSGKTSQGTCFAVTDDGTLLTAAHVVEDAKSVKIKFPKQETIPATLVTQSKADDIAVLKIQVKTPRFLVLAPSGQAKPGTRVFTIGFPVLGLLGDEPKFTEGVVSSLSGIGGERRLMQITLPIQPGNSGGPVVTESGVVVGVVTSTAAVKEFFEATGALPQGINWAVKSDLALLQFDARGEQPTDLDRDQAVALANEAVCQVMAEL